MIVEKLLFDILPAISYTDPLSLASSRVLWRSGVPMSETLRKEGVSYSRAGSLSAKMEVGVQVGMPPGLRSCATKELGG